MQNNSQNVSVPKYGLEFGFASNSDEACGFKIKNFWFQKLAAERAKEPICGNEAGSKKKTQKKTRKETRNTKNDNLRQFSHVNRFLSNSFLFFFCSIPSR